MISQLQKTIFLLIQVCYNDSLPAETLASSFLAVNILCPYMSGNEFSATEPIWFLEFINYDVRGSSFKLQNVNAYTFFLQERGNGVPHKTEENTLIPGTGK